MSQFSYTIHNITCSCCVQWERLMHYRCISTFDNPRCSTAHDGQFPTAWRCQSIKCRKKFLQGACAPAHNRCFKSWLTKKFNRGQRRHVKWNVTSALRGTFQHVESTTGERVTKSRSNFEQERTMPEGGENSRYRSFEECPFTVSSLAGL